jgi:hypothetical protein
MPDQTRGRYAKLGALATFLFGILLTVIGGRLILYDQLLTVHGREVIGEITDTGSTRRSSGGYVDFIRYRFRDASGEIHSGQSSGYSGTVGETIRLEYSPAFPFVHRVSGEGENTGYRWRWALLGIGLLFAVAGMHWFLHTRYRLRLADRLAREGAAVQGRVSRISDGGRTIEYRYATGAGSFRGKTMALPTAVVAEYSETDAVAVLYDPASHKRSVLKVEI